MTSPDHVRPRVGLVIGSGAVKCAAALGLWRVLQREGIPVDLVVGCSGGSLYAANMALGRDVETTAAMTTALWNKKITERRDYMALLRAFLPSALGGQGRFSMLSDAPLMRALSHAFEGYTFRDTTIPLYIVATDLMTGEEVTLDDGSVLDAVRASVSIPYVWPPWRLNDRWLVDGCLSAPLPVDVAMKAGADIILAMGFASGYARRIRSASRYAFQVNSVYTNNLMRAAYSFHNLAHHAEIIPILPDFDQPVGLFDTHKFKYVIERGALAAEESLPYLSRLLEQGVPAHSVSEPRTPSASS